MGDDKDKIPVLPISGVLAIVAVLGVTIFSQPFRTSRPPAPDNPEHHAKVSARLWQDPFRVVLDSKDFKSPYAFNIAAGDKSNEHKNWSEACKCRDVAHTEPCSVAWKCDKSVVLGVMVPGGPYAEDHENRMRYRYAVLSGLIRLGYIPRDPEHIEFIKIIGDDSSESYSLSNILPFEWLERQPHRGEETVRSRILVLWMNDHLFEEEPFRKMTSFAKYFAPLYEQTKTDFKIIGPARSSTLKAMIKDNWLPEGESATGKTSKELYGIYSAMATVDDRTVLRDVECERPSNRDVCNEVRNMPEEKIKDKMQNIFNAKGYKFTRIIGSDRRLALSLIDELKLRNVDLTDKKTQILLVAEADTYYGQSFEEYFMQEIDSILRTDLAKKGLSHVEVEHQIDIADIGRRIHRVSYLRGIDGDISGKDGKRKEKEGEDEEKKKDAGKGEATKERKKLEQAMGASQYDYLRRLSEEVGRLNDNSRNAGKGEITAIGVVGTDFYDKYLVLQALRQQLSDALYFTVDMDARLLHPDHIEWTRNMVVATNFQLSLRKDSKVDLQGEIPPFRDSYQTSIFFAVLRALDGETKICGAQNLSCTEGRYVAQEAKRWQKPMILEIGRRTAVLLSRPEDTVHPLTSRPYRLGWQALLKVMALVIIAPVLLILTGTTFNTYFKWIIDKPKRGPRNKVRMIPILAAAGVAFTVFGISAMAKEEPFSVLEGISVWPTEILRMIALILSWVFFYHACRIRKENADETRKEFHFEKVTPESMTWGTFVADLKNLVYWRTLSWEQFKNWLKEAMDLGWKPSPKAIALKDLWKEYVLHDKGRHRFWRVAIISALYFLFCMIIVSFDPPISPLRGKISYYADKMVVWSCVVSFIILVVYVFDVTTCCRRFISITSKAFGERTAPGSDQEMRDRLREGLDLIRLIAERSAVIGRFIFYPFIVWLVIFVSRITFFDNWRTPIGLAVVITLGAVYAWASALLLRFEAEKARRLVIGSFERMQTVSCSIDCGPEDPTEKAINKIKEIRDGAFARLSQHPVLQALLLPFGGVGGVLGIELLSKLNF